MCAEISHTIGHTWGKSNRRKVRKEVAGKECSLPSVPLALSVMSSVTAQTLHTPSLEPVARRDPSPLQLGGLMGGKREGEVE